MKTLTLLVALLCFSLGRGCITINTERFSEYINEAIDNSWIRKRGKNYSK